MRLCAEQQAAEGFTDNNTYKCEEEQDTPKCPNFVSDPERDPIADIKWKKTQQRAPQEIEAAGAAWPDNQPHRKPPRQLNAQY